MLLIDSVYMKMLDIGWSMNMIVYTLLPYHNDRKSSESIIT